MPVVEFRNFTFKYENLQEPTLKDINLSIKQGEKVLIAGRSGSGKSTLAHCINGLIPFTYKGHFDGSLTVAGKHPYEKDIHTACENVGTILQDQDGQFVGLTVGEDVAFSAENNCVPVDIMHKDVEVALREVSMLDMIEETPANLSGGQKQKVSIAGILISNAPILLFDEPLANLDPASGKKAMETINAIHASGDRTIIVIEHRIEDVLEHSFDRIVVVDEGRIVADGHPDTVLAAGILSVHGLREPLYIEMLRLSGVKLQEKDQISDLNSCLPYKENVVGIFNREQPCLVSERLEKVLSFENIYCRYYQDAPYILQDVSFCLSKGEILAVVGNNGAGKSTLARTLSGTIRPQSGRIVYHGDEINSWSPRRRGACIGHVMQNPNLMITRSTVWEEAAFGPENFGYAQDEIKERTASALETCGLYKYRNWPVSSLSYGQKKRVTIASVLSMRPDVVILDEPTAGQDHKSYREFMDYVDKISQNGTAIIMITHDMHLALEYAHRALVLSGGRIIADDSVYNILADESIMVQANLKKTSLYRLAQLYGIAEVGSFISFFTCRMKGDAEYE